MGVLADLSSNAGLECYHFNGKTSSVKSGNGHFLMPGQLEKEQMARLGLNWHFTRLRGYGTGRPSEA